MSHPSQVPYRQIRAQHDGQTVTVYQAYQPSIADAAVKAQKLNASPDFRPGRMTWVKPSWCWMMYRAGYSYKDPRQTRILALKMKQEHFNELLKRGVSTSHKPATGQQNAEKQQKDRSREKSSDVKIQWDPERTAKLEVLPYRSIQIGIPGVLSGKWANEWIFAIEDVTGKARELKKVIDERPDVTTEELVELGLIPIETPFTVSDVILSQLEMSPREPVSAD